jgi:hypothetical protein
MSRQRRKRGVPAKLVLALGAALLATACSTPSQKYGLAPPSENAAPYPNINVDPAAKPAEPKLNPQERAAAEAELEQQAGKKPQAPQAPQPK